ncbi:hypothetical protein F442_16704 [Phytophthora nicotianae P10297]|uniref:Uncharacterized protein n=3 Tax=Phytophthora nicotianae TaxID=4792 RepID=W2YLG3_PHYNI|nr:hypothetical protein L915_16403 [Phytophthora nicotianae]ETO65838.1 hypothetical protein F444_16892 [Phytophthora nicotianae P1976]ETP35044.1 hypothetical protein F442_16704 [Phytophthora nicotianae P10297]
MCRNFGIEQAIGWPAWQTGGLCLKFCDFFLVCLASARHFAAVLCRSWHCEYIWKVIFSRFFWVFVEAATIGLSSLEIQGGFEGGATLVVTCRPLSGSLEMTSEKRDFRKSTGFQNPDQGEVSPPLYETGTAAQTWNNTSSWTTLRLLRFWYST